MTNASRQRKELLQGSAAFVLGAAAGSLATLLYAPASGVVTRRRIALRARKFQRHVTRQFGQAQRVLAKKAGHVREAATEWIAERVPHGNGIRARAHHA